MRMLQTHQKWGVILSQPILGVISPLSAYSWIDNSYYSISLVNGHWSFEILSHSTHSTIFDDIVDLTSHTCIIIINVYIIVIQIKCFKHCIPVRGKS